MAAGGGAAVVQRLVDAPRHRRRVQPQREDMPPRQPRLRRNRARGEVVNRRALAAHVDAPGLGLGRHRIGDAHLGGARGEARAGAGHRGAERPPRRVAPLGRVGRVHILEPLGVGPAVLVCRLRRGIAGLGKRANLGHYGRLASRLELIQLFGVREAKRAVEVLQDLERLPRRHPVGDEARRGGERHVAEQQLRRRRAIHHAVLQIGRVQVDRLAAPFAACGFLSSMSSGQYVISPPRHRREAA